jgi:hypothetical protein
MLREIVIRGDLLALYDGMLSLANLKAKIAQAIQELEVVCYVRNLRLSKANFEFLTDDKNLTNIARVPCTKTAKHLAVPVCIYPKMQMD